jgi:hypothetical protein
MTEIELWTFQDAVEHVLDLYDLERQSLNVRKARRSILTAYRNLANAHRWSYYCRRQQVRTEASQDTGTVTYTHSTRTVTLTGSTWPANAARGKINIEDNIYEIESRTSDTEIVLPEASTPGSDITDAASYEWFRSSYPMPAGVRMASPVVKVGESRFLEHVTPHELMSRYVGNTSPSDPYIYAFHSDGEKAGEVCIEFWPPPTESKIYDFMAEVSPRQLFTEVVDTGTVTTSGTAATFDSSVLSSRNTGSIIRFSQNANLPTSVVGGLGGADNPYYAQRIITSVTSGTAAVIDSALTTEVSGVRYTISDPIDVEAGAMFSCFLRMCEAEFARAINSKDATQKEAEIQYHLRLAIAADHRDRDFGQRVIPLDFESIGDWAVIQE